MPVDNSVARMQPKRNTGGRGNAPYYVNFVRLQKCKLPFYFIKDANFTLEIKELDSDYWDAMDDDTKLTQR